MLRMQQIKIPVTHMSKDEELKKLGKKVASLLRIPEDKIKELQIIRRSVDARKKPDLYYVYTVDIAAEHEGSLLKAASKGKDKDKIMLSPAVNYHFPAVPEGAMCPRILVVGSGPAGLFCTYYLAQAGLAPILLERGKSVEDRCRDVEHFWQTGELNPQSNVQFGEGGAGTFSDGKLNTLIKDKDGRGREVLRTFVENGALEEILYDAKPHIGTDLLTGVVKNMRKRIEEWGGQVYFEHQVTDLQLTKGRVTGVMVNHSELMKCDALVLAIGHSARDTFAMLYDKELQMEQKAFAVGFRVEHPQSMINQSQYGAALQEVLGAATYKVTAPSGFNRGVYSFCMCPGGYVVNAASEEKRLAVNGMSYHDRAGRNANSAIIVQVGPEDFGGEHPLAGIAFQRRMEEKAYELAGGKIPVQRYGDFKNKVQGTEERFTIEEGFEPSCKGDYAWSDLTGILPAECNQAFLEGMDAFNRQIKGFNRPDAILLGVESRTSSPVRILRDEQLQSNIKGIYPCGEGAGYAGGITSAAMDGLRVAEMLVKGLV